MMWFWEMWMIQPLCFDIITQLFSLPFFIDIKRNILAFLETFLAHLRSESDLYQVDWLSHISTKETPDCWMWRDRAGSRKLEVLRDSAKPAPFLVSEGIGLSLSLRGDGTSGLKLNPSITWLSLLLTSSHWDTSVGTKWPSVIVNQHCTVLYWQVMCRIENVGRRVVEL